MHIAFFNCFPWEEEKLTATLGGGNTLTFYHHPLDAAHIPDQTDFEMISVFVDSTVNAEVLQHFPNLKHIATRSTGFDHIDIEGSKAKGISISSVPSYGENTVAEHAFGLLLAISKRIYDGFEQVRMHGNFNPSALEGFDLMGKTIGVIGTGRIGRHVINIAKGFGMTVIAYDPFPKPELAAELGFTYRDTLDALLAESDVVTIHVPYTKDTHHLINAENIGKMKPTAVLLNTSRGAIVDTMALVGALQEKKLAGAGLDVLEEEGAIKDELDLLAKGEMDAHDLKTVIANHALIDFPNVVITPHSAFNTREAKERILNTTLTNIQAFLQGKAENLVA